MKIMKVFIENEAGSDQKNIFDEKTLEYKKTVTVSRHYPYPYGFILNTTSGDGDNLDCFVITSQPLKSRTFVNVEPVGMFEQVEDGKDDPKILATIPGEVISVHDDIKKILQDFIEHVFDHRQGKKIAIGRFLGRDEALALIEKSLDTTISV
ncbi:inorganic diphosphatase [Candidatus Peregrinibacteria bacterium]|nr:inorganic diphosphatase [Candidatus Peregrinibacteria bacterium]